MMPREILVSVQRNMDILLRVVRLLARIINTLLFRTTVGVLATMISERQRRLTHKSLGTSATSVALEKVAHGQTLSMKTFSSVKRLLVLHLQRLWFQKSQETL
jgi:hypothetical protein